MPVFSSAMAPYILTSPVSIPLTPYRHGGYRSDKWRQYAAARGLEHWIFRREAAKLFRLERAAARRFGATIRAALQARSRDGAGIGLAYLPSAMASIWSDLRQAIS